MNANAIQKALSVAVAGQSVEAYLPDPLADEVIEFIRDLNIMRRFVNVFQQNSRFWTKPKRSGGQAAYYISDGTTATLSTYAATQVQWEAKKLMTFITVDMETIEDSQPDVQRQVLMDSADAIAEAEEQIILQGDPTHLATAPTPTSATDANWYVRDPRLMHEGIFPAATGVGAATSVNAGAAVFDLDFVNTALFNLGKYGRVKSRIVGILGPAQARQVRKNASFKDASISGQDLASFITGMGSAGEGNSLLTVIYGVPFYEAPQAPDDQAVMYRRDVPHLGDRRQIKFTQEDIIESDQRKMVVSERISFNFHYKDAMVAITNLSTAA